MREFRFADWVKEPKSGLHNFELTNIHLFSYYVDMHIWTSTYG